MALNTRFKVNSGNPPLFVVDKLAATENLSSLVQYVYFNSRTSLRCWVYLLSGQSVLCVVCVHELDKLYQLTSLLVPRSRRNWLGQKHRVTDWTLEFFYLFWMAGTHAIWSWSSSWHSVDSRVGSCSRLVGVSILDIFERISSISLTVAKGIHGLWILSNFSSMICALLSTLRVVLPMIVTISKVMELISLF